MKRTLLLLSFLFTLFTVPSWAAPLEFYAKVSAKPDEALNTKLTVAVTPSVEIDVAVTTRTDIKDTDGNPIGIDQVNVGALVEIEAVHTSGGFLALEVQLQNESDGFEIKGILELVETAALPSIQVQGFQILVGADTRIRDENRQAITMEELAQRLAEATSTGLLVKVEGTYEGEDLLASHISIVSNERFARISLEGVIADVLPPNQLVMDLGGGTEVLVNILPETEIVGDPVAGLYVKVMGQLAPNLSVNAIRIRVVGLFELSPDELEMAYGETRSVTVLLRQPLEENLVLAITAVDPSVASPSTDSLTIPAGDLSGMFDVIAGGADGKTQISVTAGEAFGGFSRNLKVEVGEGGPAVPKELQLVWTPGVVRAAPQGRVSPRLMLKYGVAPEDIAVGLAIEDPSEDLQLTYPEELTIPQGQKSVEVELLFGSQSGSGKLTATLPDSLGGSSATLDIELHSNAQSAMKINWSQKQVKAAASADITVALQLSRVAEEPVSVVVTPVAGDSAVLSSFLSPVTIPAGEQTVEVDLHSSDKSGKVKLRAALPLEQGGAHADLEIRVQ
jgi:hypothetical protein